MRSTLQEPLPVVAARKDALLLENDFVHVAPDPIFAGLDGLHQGVMRSVKMLGGVLVLGRIATAHVSALQAQAQVNPRVAGFQTLLATLAERFGSRSLLQMMTTLHISPDSQYSGA